MPKAIVSVSNDLNTDQRVHKVCLSLQKMGFEVVLVGRLRPDSREMEERPYTTKRMRMLFHKGAKFYGNFNLRLFFYLLFRRADVLVANDLDTLLANRWAKRFKRVRLVYDSHEYFTEVPELTSRPKVQAYWENIERKCLPAVDAMYTVNESIAALYRDKYNREVKVVRNLPMKSVAPDLKSRAELGLPEGVSLIILQGAWINVDRGGEEAVVAMKMVKDAVLLIAGGGDVLPYLKTEVERLALEQKVIFKDKMPFQELRQYTCHAAIGLSLDKDTNINYRYSLPNKLFDYIHGGCAVVASNLVEVARVVKTHEVGVVLERHSAEHIAELLNALLSDQNQLEYYQNNAIKAAAQLCWEKEEDVLRAVYCPEASASKESK